MTEAGAPAGATSLPLAEAVRRAVALHRAGALDDAEHLYRAILDAAPAQFDALHLLGVLQAQRGRNDDALALISRALAVKPHSVEAHANRANVLTRAGRHAEALAACDAALAIHPSDAEARNNRGLALRGLARHAEALAAFDAVIAAQPRHVGALANRARALLDLGRAGEALAACDAALAVDAAHAVAWQHRATALHELGRGDEELAAWERAVALDPACAAAWNNRAILLRRQRRDAEALASFDRALAVAPGLAEAWSNRGDILREAGRYDDAIAAYTRALEVKPDLLQALEMRGSAHYYAGRTAPALADFDRAAALDPTLGYAQSLRLLLRLHECDWRESEALREGLRAGVRNGRLHAEPFVLAVVGGTPEEQLACARATIAKAAPPATEPAWRGERYAHERIRVAYLSSDYYNHATAHLIVGLLECHDRARVEITGASYGPPVADAMRARIERACDRFLDVRGESDAAVARRLRELEIDIAVDLKGLTRDGRPGILAHRCAPVQVSWLGYPGTLGASYVDYVVADATVIPEASRQWYAEQVVWLPDSYQPNDRQRPIAAETPSRVAVGLPESGVVFCSFNNNYKITPAMFEVWMRLLRRVEGSVLWLLEGNAAAPANLRREAEARGVQAERLVFAPRMDLSQHLARHRLADVFLDTLPCNAHTTASDALWAGLPVVTCAGEAFAGRVAASLLRAAGLPELVTATLAEYEELAYELATQPERLAAVKAKLAAQRESCALFDSARFARHLESAYATMHARAQRGEPPAAFAVEAPR